MKSDIILVVVVDSGKQIAYAAFGSSPVLIPGTKYDAQEKRKE